jgi:hypothetical protein
MMGGRLIQRTIIRVIHPTKIVAATMGIMVTMIIAEVILELGTLEVVENLEVVETLVGVVALENESCYLVHLAGSGNGD